MRDLETSPDIIKSAQQLLDGATTAPWEWVGYSLESEHGMVLDFQCLTEFGMNGATREVEVTPEDEELIAAAPELAQALAEETYEYAVQAKTGSKWEHMQDGFFRDAWFSELRKAKAGARELRSIGKETRIVRRRVSPPEVISE